MSNKDLLYSTGNRTQYFVKTSKGAFPGGLVVKIPCSYFRGHGQVTKILPATCCDQKKKNGQIFYFFESDLLLPHC